MDPTRVHMLHRLKPVITLHRNGNSIGKEIK